MDSSLAPDIPVEYDVFKDASLYLFVLFTLAMLYSLVTIVRMHYFRHDTWSVQYAFNWLCFLWSALRSVYFALGLASVYNPLLFVFIYNLTVNISCATIALLDILMAQRVFASQWKNIASTVYIVYGVVNAVLFVANLAVCVWMATTDNAELSDFINTFIVTLVFIVIESALIVFTVVMVCMITKRNIPWRHFPVNPTKNSFIVVSLVVLAACAFRVIWNILLLAGYEFYFDYSTAKACVMNVAFMFIWEIVPIIAVTMLFGPAHGRRHHKLAVPINVEDGNSATGTDSPRASRTRLVKTLHNDETAKSPLFSTSPASVGRATYGTYERSPLMDQQDVFINDIESL